MKKIILLLLMTLLLTGCVIRNSDYYDSLADTVISFYKTSEYDENKIYKKDREAVSTFLQSLTHENEIIDINDYLTSVKTSEANPSSMWTENNHCYMYYSDIEDALNKAEVDKDGAEARYVTSCNGYRAVIWKSDFISYEDLITNPQYNYVLLSKDEEDNTKKYLYKSTYNGTGLLLTFTISDKIITDIETTFVNVNEYLTE